MKKFFVFLAVITMAVLTGCETKIGDEIEAADNIRFKSSSVSVISVIEDDVWKYKEGNFEFQVRVESGDEGFANDTTFTKEASLSTVSFVKDGEEVILGWEKGELVYFNGDDEISSVKVRKHLQDYLHTLDKVSGKTQEFHYEAEVKTKSGKTIMSPARNPKMEVVGTPKVVETTSDEIANYFKFAMTYSFVIDNEAKPNLVCHKTLAVEGDTVVAKTDEGFEWLTFYDNGNPKTGKSWIEITTTKNGHSTSDRKEVTLNFWQKGENYQTLVGASFAGIAEIGNGLGNEVAGQSYSPKAEITVTPMTRQYNGGVKFDEKDNVKVLEIGREVAVWSDGVNTFNMPSPAYDNVGTNFATTDLPSSNGYERKLNTITLNGSINNKGIKNVKAETELRVKEEEETFTIAVVDSAFVYLNPTTSDTKITIRETGSKGTVREYNRDVHVYNGIEAPASVTYDVDEFDSRSNAAKLNETDEYVGKRESGEFTIYKYKMGFTVGSENVDRYFRPYYERAFHNPTNTWMMWKKYENITDNGFNTTDLSNQTSGNTTYLRKKYVYAMSAVYNGHSENATGEAILRVIAPDGPGDVDPRVTPSWLGNALWAEYTRVQKTEGAQFEDMIVFGYENGVVLAPNGVANLTNGVFAYDQNVASAHGVEKCANGSAYTAVWKSSANKWIPAKCETQNAGKSNETWVYTGKGVSHSVMANNAVALGIGKNVTWNPGEEVTITNGTITVKYSRNNASLSGNDLVSLK